jgi:hypothetical protein
VVEAPVVVEPAVEGVEVGVELLGVVDHELLDADRESREQEAALQPLLVHAQQPCVALAVLRSDLLDGLVLVVGGLQGAQHLAQRAGTRPAVEGEVGEEGEGAIAHEDALAAPLVLDDVDRAVAEGGRDVAREAVARLVVVVVRVEQAIGQRLRCESSGRGHGGYSGVTVSGHPSQFNRGGAAARPYGESRRRSSSRAAP